jgi:hypothetical protein
VPWSYLGAVRPHPLNQGDILDDVVFLVPLGDEHYVESGKVMIVSHDCECDRSIERIGVPLSAAPLTSFDEIDGANPGDSGNVRAGRHSRYWALPEDPPMDGGWAVDFALLQPVLVGRLSQGRRVASIDDDGRLALVAWLLEKYGRREFN